MKIFFVGDLYVSVTKLPNGNFGVWVLSISEVLVKFAAWGLSSRFNLKFSQSLS